MNEILHEQKAYYEARAPEYDQWWNREGKYDLGQGGNQRWFDEIAELRKAFDRLPLHGDVLEFAGGTGIWTEYLAVRGSRVVALDASRAMIDENRRRLQAQGLAEKVTYRETDLFNWGPSGQYDAAFMAFWLSHVPSSLESAFLRAAVSSVKPGGLLLILEGQGDRRADFNPQQSAKQGTKRIDQEFEERTLNNGKTYRIVKRDFQPDQLSTQLKALGLQVEMGLTANQFLYAAGRKPPHRSAHTA